MQDRSNQPNPPQPTSFVKFIAPEGKALFTIRTQEDMQPLNRENGIPIHSALITLTERQVFQAGIIAPSEGAIKVKIKTEENNVFQRFITLGVRATEDPSVDGIESLISLECLLSPIVFELWMNARTPNEWVIEPEIIDNALDKLKKMAEENIKDAKEGKSHNHGKKILLP